MGDVLNGMGLCWGVGVIMGGVWCGLYVGVGFGVGCEGGGVGCGIWGWGCDGVRVILFFMRLRLGLGGNVLWLFDLGVWVVKLWWLLDKVELFWMWYGRLEEFGLCECMLWLLLWWFKLFCVVWEFMEEWIGVIDEWLEWIRVLNFDDFFGDEKRFEDGVGEYLCLFRWWCVWKLW